LIDEFNKIINEKDMAEFNSVYLAISGWILSKYYATPQFKPVEKHTYTSINTGRGFKKGYHFC